MAISPSSVVILGAGFTGARAARLLEAQGIPVTQVRSAQIDFTQPDAADALRPLLTPGCAVLHSIPTLPNRADATLTDGFATLPARVVYLSTTGVYGAVEHVDEHTSANPRNPRERLRADTEQAVQAGPWSSLILRPAAIYGPGRGVHVAIAQGKYTLLGDGSNYISRIHVDDLAALAAAALTSDLTGAYPVADAHPCPSREIAEFCAREYNLPMPVSADPANVPESRRTNRQVDGSAIRRLLGVELRYPSYLTGIPAAVQEFRYT